MKTLLAGILAAATVVAQPTGDWGRAAMMGGDGMMQGSIAGSVLGTVFFVGLILVVWLWAFKLWKEVRRMK